MNSLRVSYPIGSLTKNTKEFKKNTVQEIPSIHFHGEEGKFYTLIMSDPQANPGATKNTRPDQPSFYSYLHWLIVNIPYTFDVNEGIEKKEYKPPTPPSKKNRPNLQEIHTYFFQVYEQPNQLMDEYTQYFQKNNPSLFNVGEFVRKFGLKPVGEVKMHVRN